MKMEKRPGGGPSRLPARIVTMMVAVMLIGGFVLVYDSAPARASAIVQNHGAGIACCVNLGSNALQATVNVSKAGDTIVVAYEYRDDSCNSACLNGGFYTIASMSDSEGDTYHAFANVVANPNGDCTVFECLATGIWWATANAAAAAAGSITVSTLSTDTANSGQFGGLQAFDVSGVNPSFFNGTYVAQCIINSGCGTAPNVSPHQTTVPLGGLAIAYYMYVADKTAPQRLADANPLLYRFLLNKWYFDELYDLVFVRPAFWIGRLFWKGGDGAVIDGFGPDGVTARVFDVSRNVVRLQTGYVYHYAFAMLIGVALLATYYLFGGIR